MLVVTKVIAVVRFAAIFVVGGYGLPFPARDSERRRGKFDKDLYRQRNRVERCFNRLKQYRRVATRYEKKAENYLNMLALASIMMWL